MGFQPVGTRYRFGLVSLHNHVMCVHAKSPQLCPTLCNPMDCSLPGSSVHETLQAKYWSGLPCPPPGDLPDPGIEPTSLKSLALAGGFFTTKATWEAHSVWHGPIIPQSYSHTAWLLLNSLIGTSTPRGWMWTNRKGIIQGFSHKEMSKGVGRTCRNEKNFLNLALCSLSSG